MGWLVGVWGGLGVWGGWWMVNILNYLSYNFAFLFVYVL